VSRRTRGKKEGTIALRKDGRWCARIDLGYQNGKRRRKSIYGYTRAEVAAALTATLANTAKGEPIPDARATVASLIKQWLDSIAVTRKPRTCEFYELTARLHVIPDLGRIQLSKLEPMTVQKLIGRKAQELSPCTARHIRATLRAALSFAVKNRLITFNAASRTECAKDDHEIKPLTAEEAARLLQTAEGTPIGMMLVLAVRLGLRRGELLGLEWRDVDFAERTLKIERAVQRIKGRPLVAVPLKTKNSKRVIHMGEEVVRALREHKADQAQQRLASTEWHDMGLIFCNSIGKPWEPRAVNALFDRCVERAGLPPATRLHDCRHTCATLLLAAGADLLSVSRMLGHATIGVTADTYAHPNQESAERLTAVMDTVMVAK
jgi:integrase